MHKKNMLIRGKKRAISVFITGRLQKHWELVKAYFVAFCVMSCQSMTKRALFLLSTRLQTVGR